MTNKPIYPLTEAEDQELEDHHDSHSSQYDSLAEWKNEVVQFGDASFQKPIIQPLTYPDHLEKLVTKASVYFQELAEWESNLTEEELDAAIAKDEIIIPF